MKFVGSIPKLSLVGVRRFRNLRRKASAPIQRMGHVEELVLPILSVCPITVKKPVNVTTLDLNPRLLRRRKGSRFRR
jgi:hypothetical protein